MKLQSARSVQSLTVASEVKRRTALAELQGFVQRRRMAPPGKDFEQFERDLHEKVMAVERELLAEDMERADVDAPAIVYEGATWRRAMRAEATYMTAAGEVRVERTLYRDRTDPAERALVPMEKRLGIVEDFWTPLAARTATWVVAQMTPKLGEELLERVGNMQPSKSSLDRLPKALSERWEDNRKEFEQLLQVDTLIPPGTTSVCVSIDGVLAPMKDGEAVATRARAARAGRISKGPAGYREIGCATLSFCNAQGDMISAVRVARMPESRKLSLKKTLLAELNAVLAQRPDLPIVKVADAADDNWRFLSDEVPDNDGGASAIDFFHAAEHLHAAVAVVYGDGTLDTRRTFQDWRTVLLEDPEGVEKVIRSLAYLKRKHPKIGLLATTLAYFRKHRPRMRYAELRARGLPVGSGVVEAACKTLVAQRMKQSGMRWSHDGGQAILTTRGWAQSDRFDRAWAQVAATYRAEITLMNNVVVLPLPPREKSR